jgi:hypothetical protein
LQISSGPASIRHFKESGSRYRTLRAEQRLPQLFMLYDARRVASSRFFSLIPILLNLSRIIFILFSEFCIDVYMASDTIKRCMYVTEFSAF